MTAPLDANLKSKRRFFGLLRLMLVIITVMIVLALLWFGYHRMQQPSPLVKSSESPAEKTAQDKKIYPEASTSEDIPSAKPVPKKLNLKLAPIEQTEQVGPVLVPDEPKQDLLNSADQDSTSPSSPSTELKYGYKGHDDQSVHLELGAEEKSMQIKLGVQAGENKVDVNSIEVEIPLSK